MQLVLSVPTLAKILGMVGAWVLPGYTTWNWITPRHGYCLRTLHMAGLKHEYCLGMTTRNCIRAVPEIILGGGGRKHFFVLWVEGVLLTMCPRAGGGEVTCPGGQGVFDP